MGSGSVCLLVVDPPTLSDDEARNVIESNYRNEPTPKFTPHSFSIPLARPSQPASHIVAVVAPTTSSKQDGDESNSPSSLTHSIPMGVKRSDSELSTSEGYSNYCGSAVPEPDTLASHEQSTEPISVHNNHSVHSSVDSGPLAQPPVVFPRKASSTTTRRSSDSSFSHSNREHCINTGHSHEQIDFIPRQAVGHMQTPPPSRAVNLTTHLGDEPATEQYEPNWQMGGGDTRKARPDSNVYNPPSQSSPRLDTYYPNSHISSIEHSSSDRRPTPAKPNSSSEEFLEPQANSPSAGPDYSYQQVQALNNHLMRNHLTLERLRNEAIVVSQANKCYSEIASRFGNPQLALAQHYAAMAGGFQSQSTMDGIPQDFSMGRHNYDPGGQ